MSLPFRVGGSFLWRVPGGSLGNACDLPRPHDDVDADADADAAAAADDDDGDDDDDDDDDDYCGSALRLRANDGVKPYCTFPTTVDRASVPERIAAISSLR